MVRVQTARGTEAAAHGDAFLYAQTGKGLRDLESPGNAGFGDAVGRFARDWPTVKLDAAFIAVKTGDQIVYGGFTGSVGPGDAEYLTLLHLEAQIVYCFQCAEPLGDIEGLEHRTPLYLIHN